MSQHQNTPPKPYPWDPACCVTVPPKPPYPRRPEDDLLLSPWWIGAIVAGAVITLIVIIILLVVFCRRSGRAESLSCREACITCRCRRYQQPYRQRRRRHVYPSDGMHDAYVTRDVAVYPPPRSIDSKPYRGGSVLSGYSSGMMEGDMVQREVLADAFQYDGHQHVVVDDHYEVARPYDDRRYPAAGFSGGPITLSPAALSYSGGGAQQHSGSVHIDVNVYPSA